MFSTAHGPRPHLHRARGIADSGIGGTADYRRAVAAADDDGVTLPVDPSFAAPTPWDPPLATAFGERRLVVHEERLLPGLLEA